MNAPLVATLFALLLAVSGSSAFTINDAALSRLTSQKSSSISSTSASSEASQCAENDLDVRIFQVPPKLHNKRIDAALTALVNDDDDSGQTSKWSRSACGAMVTDGHVQLVAEDGGSFTPIERKSHKVSKGDSLRVDLKAGGRDDTPTEIEPQDLPLDVLFEDEHMIVLNKAAGMVVHPAAGNWDGTVVHALAYHLLHRSTCGAGEFLEATSGSTAMSVTMGDIDQEEDTNDEIFSEFSEKSSMLKLRPGIVHRLDKGTTGVLVVAKTHQALAALSKAFHDREVRKAYLCISVGNPGTRITIDNRIGRHPIHRQRMRVIPNGRSSDPRQRRKLLINPEMANAGRRAVSYVDTVAFAPDQKLSVVQVRIATGRTHQIRVHLQDRRTPIYGDEVYGIKDWNQRLERTHGITRPLLHAYQLELKHPVTGEDMTFTAQLPEDMKGIAKTIWNTAQQHDRLDDDVVEPEFLK